MASYRGLKAEQIVESLRAAKAFVEGLDIPAVGVRVVSYLSEQARADIIEGHLQNLRAEYPEAYEGYDALEIAETGMLEAGELEDDALVMLIFEEDEEALIESGDLEFACADGDRKSLIEGVLAGIDELPILVAESDEDLAAVMEDVNARLEPATDLFLLHGILNTNGAGTEVARGLYAFGGINSMGSPRHTPKDLKAAMQQHRADYPEMTDEQMQIYEELVRGMHLKRYAVECTEDEKDDVGERIQLALGSFRLKGEAGEVFALLPGQNAEHFAIDDGVVFDATQEAAHHVAIMLPEYIVLDDAGETVTSRHLKSVDVMKDKAAKHRLLQ